MTHSVENISTSVFAYLRTSSAANLKGDNNPNTDSDTRQRAAIEAYAASRGMTVAVEFTTRQYPGQTRSLSVTVSGTCSTNVPRWA
jgi:hypothetical protein